MDSYEAYLDESGAHHSRFFVVGGYIADINAWAELSVSWKAILDEYKLPYFRMTDYKNSHSRLFHHLSRTNKEHVLDALLKCIGTAAMFAVAASVRPREYNALTTHEFRSYYGTSYALCVSGCVGFALTKLPELTSSTKTVGIFLEEGHRNALQALEHLGEFKVRNAPINLSDYEDGIPTKELSVNEIGVPIDPIPTLPELLRQVGYKIGAYGLGSKLAMVPLQAADILVHCVYSIATLTEPQYYYDVLTKVGSPFPYYHMNLNKEMLQEFIKVSDVDKEIGRKYDDDAYRLVSWLEPSGYGQRSYHGVLGLPVQESSDAASWNCGRKRRTRSL